VHRFFAGCAARIGFFTGFFRLLESASSTVPPATNPNITIAPAKALARILFMSTFLTESTVHRLTIVPLLWPASFAPWQVNGFYTIAGLFSCLLHHCQRLRISNYLPSAEIAASGAMREIGDEVDGAAW
jgi:hypothetical protein